MFSWLCVLAFHLDAASHRHLPLRVSSLHRVDASCHCIASCHRDASRHVALLLCCILFIWLSRYLSQSVDLHPCRMTLTLTPSLLIFCPLRPNAAATFNGRPTRLPKRRLMPSHLPMPPPHRLFDCCVLLHLLFLAMSSEH